MVVILDDIDLSTLCGVLACSDVVVGNDSGVRHLAGAVGSPTVGIFWIGDMVKVGPFGRSRDRALISWTTKCPVCGSDWPTRGGSSVPQKSGCLGANIRILSSPMFRQSRSSTRSVS